MQAATAFAPPVDDTARRSWRAGVRYFVVLFAIGFVLGAIRVPLLVPRLGERTAELLELPLLVAASAIASKHIVRHHAIPARSAMRARVGAMALLLMVLAELAVVRIVREQSLASYFANRDPVALAAYVVALLLFAAMPLLVARREPEAVNDR